MPRTVLVVEDEFLIAMDLQAMLERSGWQVMGPAPTVAMALDLLESGLPTIALLDINLGNELVTRVAETLKASGVPFAVASAYEKPEQVCGEILAGVLNAGKPTNERRLLSVLEQLTAA
ncbi:MAG: response regulator [Candidatus Andeanibacterium colombiense]|uniref:Response regulator n=1 Tax=Candidatus Andeanibacterium colombiense TaxID=3121345 RepID=A0AAJ5XBJ0_9SPHN|nr:MAG: response regulator [Sphingomonadaceae bacterium]